MAEKAAESSESEQTKLHIAPIGSSATAAEGAAAADFTLNIGGGAGEIADAVSSFEFPAFRRLALASALALGIIGITGTIIGAGAEKVGSDGRRVVKS